MGLTPGLHSLLGVKGFWGGMSEYAILQDPLAEV